MPIDRVRDNGTVFRKKLNAKRPAIQQVGPIYPIIFFNATTMNPDFIVQGDALVERNNWSDYIKSGFQTLDFETYVDFQPFSAVGGGLNTNLNGVTLNFPVPVFTPGGNAYNPAVSWTADNSPDAEVDGRWNTTTGGIMLMNRCLTTHNYGPGVNQPQSAWYFSPFISALGMYMTDMGDFLGTFDVRLTRDDDVQLMYRIVDTQSGGVPYPEGALSFFGFVDALHSYKKLEFFCSVDFADVFGIDDLFFGKYEVLKNP